MSEPTAPRRAPPPPPGFLRRNWIALLLLGLALAWAWNQAELSPSRFFGGAGKMAQYLFGEPGRPDSGFFPPDFGLAVRADGTRDWTVVRLLGRRSAETLAIALWGTALSLGLALPLALLGSRPVAEVLIDQRWLRTLVYGLARRVMDFLRAVNEIVFALIFVAAVGLGPFPGVLALALHTAGVLGKLVSEAADAIDRGPMEAVTAAGAGRFQIIAHGIWPQISPHAANFLAYRFETNIRAATVVGMTGAGGLGYQLFEASRGFQSRRVCAVLLIIFGMVAVTDWGMGLIRKRMVGGDS